VAFTYFKVKSTKCLCLLPVVLANSYEFRLVYIIAENTAGDNRFSSFCCCALTAGDRVAGGGGGQVPLTDRMGSMAGLPPPPPGSATGQGRRGVQDSSSTVTVFLNVA